MTDDIYSAFAQRLGTTRAEAKRRAYERAYDMAVEVLAPGEEVPAGVELPQVTSHSTDDARSCWRMTTQIGQRFLVPYEVAYNMEGPMDRLIPGLVLGEAFKQHRAVWL